MEMVGVNHISMEFIYDTWNRHDEYQFREG